MSHESPKELSEGLKSRIVGLHKAVKVYEIEVFENEKRTLCLTWKGYWPSS